MALRAGVALLSGLTALMALAGAAAPAAAQYGAQPSWGYSAPRYYRYYPSVSPYPFSPYGGYSPYGRSWGDEWEEAPRPPATYRTLCVRLCDGYYFPISAAATLGTLSRDMEACRSSCGSEARLFYHPSIGGSAETMVDVTGLAYSSLRNAFLYRKTLVEGCRCRPEPWSQSEIDRHRSYAEGTAPSGPAGSTGSLRSAAKPTAQAGAAAQRPSRPAATAPDPRAVERPQPVARQVEQVAPLGSGSGGGAAPSKYSYGWSDADRTGR
jgi:hypothetical protein